MAISTYGELQAAAANWLVKGDLTARIPEFIALAETRLNRVWPQPHPLALSDASPTNGMLLVCPDVYLFGTLCEAGPWMRDAELAAAYEARFARALEEGQRRKTDNRLAAPPSQDTGAGE